MFNVGVDVASLGLTVYVLGFAFGPIVCEWRLTLILNLVFSLYFLTGGKAPILCPILLFSNVL